MLRGQALTWVLGGAVSLSGAWTGQGVGAEAERVAGWVLPAGFEAVAGTGVDAASGLPKRIRCAKDGAEMILIPAGRFLFGPKNEPRDEEPFYIDRFPVTNEQFARFLKETGHKSGRWICGCHGGPWRGDGKSLRCPAVSVTWIDALAYCRWAVKQLPTESRWEKAARGTDGRPYPSGNELRAAIPRKGTPYDVGSCPAAASPYGVEDMYGNVCELTVGSMEGGGYDRRCDSVAGPLPTTPHVTGVVWPKGWGWHPVLKGGPAVRLHGQREVEDGLARRLTYAQLIRGAPCSEACIEVHGTAPGKVGFRCVVVPARRGRDVQQAAED